MTTILCDVRNGLLAVDSFRNLDGTMLLTPATVIKGRRLSDGSILGWSGSVEQGMAWAEWMTAKSEGHLCLPGSCPQDLDDFLGLHLTASGQLYRYEKRCVPYQIDEPFYGIGYGADWAMAAMACGKDIVDAMRLACRYSPYTCPPIRVYSLKDVEPLAYKE